MKNIFVRNGLLGIISFGLLAIACIALTLPITIAIVGASVITAGGFTISAFKGKGLVSVTKAEQNPELFNQLTQENNVFMQQSQQAQQSKENEEVKDLPVEPLIETTLANEETNKIEFVEELVKTDNYEPDNSLEDFNLNNEKSLNLKKINNNEEKK